MIHELRECPFCGSKAELKEGHEHNYIGGYSIDIIIECSNCSCALRTHYGVNGKDVINKEDAEKYLIESWNNRI